MCHAAAILWSTTEGLTFGVLGIPSCLTRLSRGASRPSKYLMEHLCMRLQRWRLVLEVFCGGRTVREAARKPFDNGDGGEKQRCAQQVWDSVRNVRCHEEARRKVSEGSKDGRIEDQRVALAGCIVRPRKVIDQNAWHLGVCHCL